MNRRSVIAAGTTGLLGVGGLGLVHALSPSSSDDESFDYRGRAPIVYERSDLSLDLLHDPVSHGRVAEFELTNVGTPGSFLVAVLHGRSNRIGTDSGFMLRGHRNG